MNVQLDVLTAKRYARITGFFYLIIIVCGIFSEIGVRSQIIVAENAEITLQNIIASQNLFRVGFFSDLLMVISDIAVAALFFILLEPVDKLLSLAAMAFRLIEAAIIGFNLLHYFAPLLLLHDKTGEQAMILLQMHQYGYDLALVFFAVSCFITGYLLIKSKLFTSWLGYGLIASGAVYLLGSFSVFTAPQLAELFEPAYVIPFIAESALAVWLLTKGVKTQTI